MVFNLSIQSTQPKKGNDFKLIGRVTHIFMWNHNDNKKWNRNPKIKFDSIRWTCEKSNIYTFLSFLNY